MENSLPQRLALDADEVKRRWSKPSRLWNALPNAAKYKAIEDAIRLLIDRAERVTFWLIQFSFRAQSWSSNLITFDRTHFNAHLMTEKKPTWRHTQAQCHQTPESKSERGKQWRRIESSTNDSQKVTNCRSMRTDIILRTGARELNWLNDIRGQRYVVYAHRILFCVNLRRKWWSKTSVRSHICPNVVCNTERWWRRWWRRNRLNLTTRILIDSLAHVPTFLVELRRGNILVRNVSACACISPAASNHEPNILCLHDASIGYCYWVHSVASLFFLDKSLINDNYYYINQIWNTLTQTYTQRVAQANQLNKKSFIRHVSCLARDYSICLPQTAAICRSNKSTPKRSNPVYGSRRW